MELARWGGAVSASAGSGAGSGARASAAGSGSCAGAGAGAEGGTAGAGAGAAEVVVVEGVVVVEEADLASSRARARALHLRRWQATRTAAHALRARCFSRSLFSLRSCLAAWAAVGARSFLRPASCRTSESVPDARQWLSWPPACRTEAMVRCLRSQSRCARFLLGASSISSSNSRRADHRGEPNATCVRESAMAKKVQPGSAYRNLRMHARAPTATYLPTLRLGGGVGPRDLPTYPSS